jgi:4-amino-4-deoxychorismate lyase
MSQLIETIKISGRQFQNIAFHNNRFNKARKELLSCDNLIDISETVIIPATIGNEIYKCTVTYDSEIKDATFQLYTIRRINCFKLVADNNIEYSYKFSDRSSLNKLLERKEECDEIIIVKNGFITDTSFSNLVFFDGKKWHTPSSPLLKGTKRGKLLSEGMIIESEISKGDLTKFEKVGLINAMLEIGDIVADVSSIKQ